MPFDDRSQGIIAESPLIRIRRTQAKDLDFVLQTEVHEENLPFISQWSKSRHEEAIMSADMEHVIAESASGERVGYAMIAGLQNIHLSVELMRIAMARKGQGYGRETLRLLAEWAFETLHAHRLWLDVREHNVRAKTLYLSCGFVQEGMLRDCVRIGGGYQSLEILSMLETEYADRKKA